MAKRKKSRDLPPRTEPLERPAGVAGGKRPFALTGAISGGNNFKYSTRGFVLIFLIARFAEFTGGLFGIVCALWYVLLQVH